MSKWWKTSLFFKSTPYRNISRLLHVTFMKKKVKIYTYEGLVMQNIWNHINNISKGMEITLLFWFRFKSWLPRCWLWAWCKRTEHITVNRLNCNKCTGRKLNDTGQMFFSQRYMWPHGHSGEIRIVSGIVGRLNVSFLNPADVMAFKPSICIPDLPSDLEFCCGSWKM